MGLFDGITTWWASEFEYNNPENCKPNLTKVLTEFTKTCPNNKLFLCGSIEQTVDAVCALPPGASTLSSDTTDYAKLMSCFNSNKLCNAQLKSAPIPVSAPSSSPTAAPGPAGACDYWLSTFSKQELSRLCSSSAADAPNAEKRPITCGPGTTMKDNVCNGYVCGPGTVLDGGQCNVE